MSLTLIGGTGGLGFEIAKGLASATGFTALRAVVRNRDAQKSKELEAMGWTIVVVTDFQNEIAVKEAFEGTKTVVSAFGGRDLVSLEMTALRAAKHAGASLYVPSQFGVDHRRWGSSFPFLTGKKKILDTAKELDMPTLSVFCGYFSDWIFDFLADPANAKGRLIGDGGTKISFTRRSDIGYVLAKALVDPKLAKGGILSLQGDCKTWMEAIQMLEKIKGKRFELDFLDPQEALKQEQDLLQKGMAGDVGAFYGAFGLHLLGEPARGNTGCDLRAEAKSYGVKLESLEETLSKVYAEAEGKF